MAFRLFETLLYPGEAVFHGAELLPPVLWSYWFQIRN